MRTALLFLAGAVVGFRLAPAILAVLALGDAHLTERVARENALGIWRAGWSAE